jgi:type VI secretion system secreted protein VgrG
MKGTEALSRLFTYELDLLSLDHTIAISDLLGQSMTVTLETRLEGVRYFNGVVSRFSYVGSHGLYARYQATLRPSVWFLTRAANCRIAQGESSVDIFKRILGDHGTSDIDISGIAAPPVREYCTQYRESDFDFINRILEHDGIYYYFRHEDGKHTLVLADNIGCHSARPNYETLPWDPEGSSASSEDDRFLEWYLTQEVQTGVYSHTDYDFTKPKAKLETRGVIARTHPNADLEAYDYPGRYVETSVGETIARMRIEEKQTLFEFGYGSGTVRGVGCGDLFTMTDHPRPDLNLEYLVISSSFQGCNPEYETSMETAPAPFRCNVTAVDARVHYRPERITVRPTVQGPQTARVTGPGSEPWTDEYGRVKVHFHWDRTGPTNENSSCWVRVSQASAGKNWGAMFLPHPGQEVIVDFLEGDPDQPIVTGRVYNADNMPPKELPSLNRISMIRDEYGNQLVFDSTPGSEHIRLSSPHHQSSLVLGQSTVDVTWSNKTVYTLGTTWTHSKGDSASFAVGNWFSYKKGLGLDIQLASSAAVQLGSAVSLNIGGKLNLQAGVEVSLTAAVKAGFGWSRELNYNKAAYARLAKEDIKMDSEKEVWLCGGKNDATIVKAGTDEITLAFGEGQPRSTGRDLAIPGAIIASAGSLASTAGQYWSQSAEYESTIKNATDSWKFNEKKDEATAKLDVEKLSLSTGGNVTEAVGYLATIAGAVMAVAGKDIADPKHTAEKAKITINEHGVLIQSGDDKSMLKDPGVKILGKNQCGAWFDDNGIVEIVSKSGDIFIRTGGTIHLDANVVCTKDLDVKGNFTDPRTASKQ